MYKDELYGQKLCLPQTKTENEPMSPRENYGSCDN